jgi:hypothetical protein
VSNEDQGLELIGGLGRWQNDGTLDKILTTLIETAELAGLIDWGRLVTDGFFSRGKGGEKKLNMDLREKEQLPIIN